MKRTSKPVRDCHGCGLNFGDRCGVYENPHQMWHNRKCPGHMNEAMLREYQDRIAHKKDLDARKEKRREVAKSRATEDHHTMRQPVVTVKH
jgi:hypothetical protein